MDYKVLITMDAEDDLDGFVRYQRAREIILADLKPMVEEKRRKCKLDGLVQQIKNNQNNDIVV